MLSIETSTANEPPLQTPPARVLGSWQQFDVSDEVLAGALHVDPRALVRWRGGMYPQLASRRRLAMMDSLQQHLRSTFADDAAVRDWLEADSRYLGGLKPIEALRAGRIDRVEVALTALDSGTFV